MKFINTIKARFASVVRVASALRSVPRLIEDRGHMLNQINALQEQIEELEMMTDILESQQVTEYDVQQAAEDAVQEAIDLGEIARIVVESCDFESAVHESVNSYFADAEIVDLIHQVVDHCDFEYKVEQIAKAQSAKVLKHLALLLEDE